MFNSIGKISLEDKNTVCEKISQFLYGNNNTYTRKDQESTYFKVVSDCGKWIQIRVSTHFENDNRRQLCDLYFSSQSVNGFDSFMNFINNNNLRFSNYGQ